MSLLGKSSDVWRRIYDKYDTVMKAKAETQKDPKKRKELLSQDEWFQQELPVVISSRSEKYITHEELVRIMKWKLMRGKFRPRLQQMVEENRAESVEAASRKAFKALPNLRGAVEALTVLRAVGPATASAILAAGAPQRVPFMADESMLALPGLQPLQYTLSAFLTYANKVAAITKTLQQQDNGFLWSPHRVELALWTLQMAKMLKLDSVVSLLSPTTTQSATDASNTSQSTTDKRKKRTTAEQSSKKRKT